MVKTLLGGWLALAACMAVADDSDAASLRADVAQSHCERVTELIGAHYSRSFDKIVARKPDQEEFFNAVLDEMSARLEASPVPEYAALWTSHFRAVGNELPHELIAGYIHYQCDIGNHDVPIRAVSDRIDASCWRVARDAREAADRARLADEDPAEQEREGRRDILTCIRSRLAN